MVSCSIFLFIFFLVSVLQLLREILDLLLTDSEMVVLSFLVLVLKGHFLDEHSIGISHIWELKVASLSDAWCVEIDSEVSPLTL